MTLFDQSPVRIYGNVEIYCTKPHSHKDGTKWRIAPGAKMGVIVQRNGLLTHYLYCPLCGTSTGHLPKHVVEHLLARGVQPERRKVNDPADYPPCSYRACDNPAKHWHHSAPRNTFPDANSWPVMPYCEEHHRIWHQTMDGYRWSAKTPSRDCTDWLPEHRMKLLWGA